MAISQQDIKLLWGRAASRCSICRKELSYNNPDNSANIIVGQQAHIVSESENGPRGKSTLSAPERDVYDNLILLCPNHHVEIDTDELAYPIERLHSIKTAHELWVKSTLTSGMISSDDVNGLIYSKLIDSIVELCCLYDWNSWSSYVASTRIIMDTTLFRNGYKLRKTIMGAAFPGTLIELEESIRAISMVFNTMINIFAKHSEIEGDNMVEVKFYKNFGYDPELYDSKCEKYELWQETVISALELLTKTLNWFSVIVRRDINPLFFALEGKFVVEYNDGLYTHASLHEFRLEERGKEFSIIKSMLIELNCIDVD